MLSIKNLHACVEDKQILNGLNLEIKAGEIHAIMGPNGSGKSTLSQVLVGNEEFDVTAGEVTFNGDNLLDLATEERAREGIFLAFQYPVEIPGVIVVPLPDVQRLLRESMVPLLHSPVFPEKKQIRHHR